MKINADFTAKAVVHASKIGWIPSPMAGVERKMLDRIGNEVARATSLVRYAPGSSFKPHTHGGGEEFLVLEGTFQDEHGDYPVGSYVRNPPTSNHTPKCDDGAVIFVKLWQFDLKDRNEVKISSNSTKPVVCFEREGVSKIELFKDLDEEVRLEEWENENEIEFKNHGGIEIFVLSGSFILNDESKEVFQKYSWLRLPTDQDVNINSLEKCKVWIKTGHLRKPPQAPLN